MAPLGLQNWEVEKLGVFRWAVDVVGMVVDGGAVLQEEGNELQQTHHGVEKQQLTGGSLIEGVVG